MSNAANVREVKFPEGKDTIKVVMPDRDVDIMLCFGGQIVVIQARPTNAEENYHGSLDVILPEPKLVTNLVGESMKASYAPNKGRPHERYADQLVMELPGPTHSIQIGEFCVEGGFNDAKVMRGDTVLKEFNNDTTNKSEPNAFLRAKRWAQENKTRTPSRR
jgi:hypothetical protein